MVFDYLDGGADDEDHLVAAEAVHLGHQLVDHGVLDPGPRVRAAALGEGVELVEDDDRRGRGAGIPVSGGLRRCKASPGHTARLRFAPCTPS